MFTINSGYHFDSEKVFKIICTAFASSSDVYGKFFYNKPFKLDLSKVQEDYEHSMTRKIVLVIRCKGNKFVEIIGEETIMSKGEKTEIYTFVITSMKRD